MADIALRVDDLERWRDGNGKPGAAAILADHEKRITRAECDTLEHNDALHDIDVHHATEHERVVKAVGEALAKRSKSVEGVIRAFGPYVAAIAAIACAVIEMAKD